MDEYKKYVKVKTFCKQCGRHINREANFIEHRCECGNWIPLTAFSEVNGTKGKMKTRVEKRREGLEKIYGEKRGNKCLESDFEECFWDGYDRGYAAGYAAEYAAALAKTHIKEL